MRPFTNLTIATGAIASVAIATSAKAQTPKPTTERPNVLFICIDDLRTELGCYGSMVKSPNLDNLASEGSLFENHYVQVPTSGASRSSMLSGYLPKCKGDVGNDACHNNFAGKLEGEHPETIFHNLRRNGYYTVGMGKISHSEDGLDTVPANAPYQSDRQLPHSWDELLADGGKWGSGQGPFFAYADGSTRASLNKVCPPYECGDVSDTGYPDGLTANLAVETLERLAQNPDQPFCLTVGFYKPHLPFNSPKKYWDMYDREDIEVSEYDIPIGVNLSSLQNSGEFNQYQTGDEKASLERPVSDEYAKKLRHAYYACVSYTDAQVGKILDKLDELGIADNTIIVVWGDHGWNLGDMRVWGKHTAFDTSLRSTLIVKAPGKKSGVKNNRIVSSVDLYPTLMELCGVDCPDDLDGHSFANLLSKPKDKRWSDIAYSYWGNKITMRTPDYRITRSANNQVELFKYERDGVYERENIAGDNPKIIEQLMPNLLDGNRGSVAFEK